MDENYKIYLLSPEWDKKREMVLIFWNYRCALCYSDIDVNIHHRTYERLYHELLTDLIPLCSDCHGKFHAGARSGSATINEVINLMAVQNG